MASSSFNTVRKPKVVRKVFEVSKTFSAGEAYTYEASVNDETGYTPIGIVGVDKWGAGNQNISISNFLLTSSLVFSVSMRNNSTQSIAINHITADVLYI